MKAGLTASLALALAIPSAAAAAAAPPPILAVVAPLSNGLEARNGGLAMRVTALTDSILRVRIAPRGAFPEDASWAVPASLRSERVAVRGTRDGFATAALTVRVDPMTLRLTVTDAAGKVLIDDAPQPVGIDGRRFTLKKVLPLGEHIYGMGDKTGSFDRRGESFVDWNTDAWGFQRDTDPIYKSIPFYIGEWQLRRATACSSTIAGAAGSISAIGTPAQSRSASEGGPIDYYVIAGPDRSRCRPPLHRPYRQGAAAA